MSSDFKAPNQPRGFKYPLREFGKTKIVRRCFQKQWYDMFSLKEIVSKFVCRYIAQILNFLKNSK